MKDLGVRGLWWVQNPGFIIKKLILISTKRYKSCYLCRESAGPAEPVRLVRPKPDHFFHRLNR